MANDQAEIGRVAKLMHEAFNAHIASRPALSRERRYRREEKRVEWDELTPLNKEVYLVVAEAVIKELWERWNPTSGGPM